MSRSAHGEPSDRGLPRGPVLVLDASTARGSVAVLRDGQVVAEVEATLRGAAGERLMPAVTDVLAQGGAAPTDLAGIVCGGGPGGFTGLRIAAGIAKGMAYGIGVPLHAVGSLELIVAGAAGSLAPGRYLAAIDAMRGERFVQAMTVDGDGAVAADGGVQLLTVEALRELSDRCGAVAIGPAEERVAWPGAGGVVARWRGGGPRRVDVRAWEPDYGRLAEAQSRWEAAHGRALPAG